MSLRPDCAAARALCCSPPRSGGLSRGSAAIRAVWRRRPFRCRATTKPRMHQFTTLLEYSLDVFLAPRIPTLKEPAGHTGLTTPSLVRRCKDGSASRRTGTTDRTPKPADFAVLVHYTGRSMLLATRSLTTLRLARRTPLSASACAAKCVFLACCARTNRKKIVRCCRPIITTDAGAIVPWSKNAKRCRTGLLGRHPANSNTRQAAQWPRRLM